MGKVILTFWADSTDSVWNLVVDGGPRGEYYSILITKSELDQLQRLITEIKDWNPQV